jgi:hypothetical protein
MSTNAVVGDGDPGEPVRPVREERHGHVADQPPAVLWTLDAALRVTSSLGVGLATLGLRPNQLVGLTLFEVFRTDDPGHPSIANHRRALAGESLRYEEVRAGRSTGSTSSRSEVPTGQSRASSASPSTRPNRRRPRSGVG